MNEIEFYGVGLVHLSACAPKDATAEQIESAANLRHPTGIESQWKLSDAPTFSGGEPNPCPCEQHPADRRHVLLVC
jgi:hypothetical protein